jgi:hypothetical protein
VLLISIQAKQEGYGARMGERLFLFVQLELPWELGPADGRYLLRGGPDREPEQVVVLNTVGAARRERRRLGARRPRATPQPAPVATARATVVDPVPVATERQAQRWLSELDAERETRMAAATVNRVLFAHRIATANPHLNELSPSQALVVRAGWGEGEQVAYGRWLHARELPWRESRVRRSAALRPQERLTVLLSARGQALMCEELALRARMDLDQGRISHAALELEQAYTAALTELPREDRGALTVRIAELAQLRSGVVGTAHLALGDGSEPPDKEIVSHALERLEAALRARTALGFSLE